jgi:hypothetical protein
MKALRENLKKIGWTMKIKQSKFSDSKKYVTFYHISGLNTNANVFSPAEIVFIKELQSVISDSKFPDNVYGYKI